MSLNKYSKEDLLEMSLIEIAYELLTERNEPIFFQDLMKEIASLQGLSKAEVEKRIAQFYTDLNVDGRFTSLGENRWGLKIWYPVDQIEEEVVHAAAKPKKKKKAKKAAVVVDDFDELDEEDLDFDDDIEEDEDDVDEDDDDILADADIDEVLIDDDVEEDEEDLEDEIIEDEAFVLDDEEEEDEEEEDKEEK